MSRRTATLALVLALAGAGGLAAWRAGVADEARRREGIEASRIRGWARAEGGAGVSVLPKRVPAADDGTLRRLEALPGFHAYAMRCSSCHVLPDPAAYTGGGWMDKVDEMREHSRRAGLVPPPDEEMEQVRTFLRRASELTRSTNGTENH